MTAVQQSKESQRISIWGLFNVSCMAWASGTDAQPEYDCWMHNALLRNAQSTLNHISNWFGQVEESTHKKPMNPWIPHVKQGIILAVRGSIMARSIFSWCKLGPLINLQISDWWILRAQPFKCVTPVDVCLMPQSGKSLS